MAGSFKKVFAVRLQMDLLICCILHGRNISIPTVPVVPLACIKEKYPHVNVFLIWKCSFRSYP